MYALLCNMYNGKNKIFKNIKLHCFCVFGISKIKCIHCGFSFISFKVRIGLAVPPAIYIIHIHFFQTIGTS